MRSRPPVTAAADRKHRLRPVLSAIVVAGLLWWFLRGVSLGDLVAEIRQARLPYVAGAVMLSVSGFLFRIARWRYPARAVRVGARTVAGRGRLRRVGGERDPARAGRRGGARGAAASARGGARERGAGHDRARAAAGHARPADPRGRVARVRSGRGAGVRTRIPDGRHPHGRAHRLWRARRRRGLHPAERPG